jgi:hypothetical protein
MEHKNSFHIKKLNHQSGFGWAEMMRAGYVWLAALLCFIWYAADRFEMDTAGVFLSGQPFLYYCISLGYLLEKVLRFL